VVGRGLRRALPTLGASLRALEGKEVYMVSEAAEDLSFSFVVDEEQADGLVLELHRELLEGDLMEKDPQYGPTWQRMPCGTKQIPGDAKH